MFEMLSFSLLEMLKQNHAKVSLEDFELLKVLGTGGRINFCFFLFQCI